MVADVYASKEKDEDKAFKENQVRLAEAKAELTNKLDQQARIDELRKEEDLAKAKLKITMTLEKAAKDEQERAEKDK
tara:strand:+ start:186 stop:416 length:231 start_codon:yes stop_codon:yes gene_type:complete